MGTKDNDRRGGLAALGDVMRQYLDASGLGQRLRDWPVYDAWRVAVGEELARRARPVDYRRGGELVVEVESAAHLQELRNFTGERYRALANQRLGQERIRRVTFKLKR